MRLSRWGRLPCWTPHDLCGHAVVTKALRAGSTRQRIRITGADRLVILEAKRASSRALLYALEDPALAPAHLDGWLTWASRSRLATFIKLARTIRRHRAGIHTSRVVAVANQNGGTREHDPS